MLMTGYGPTNLLTGYVDSVNDNNWEETVPKEIMKLKPWVSENPLTNWAYGIELPNIAKQIFFVNVDKIDEIEYMGYNNWASEKPIIIL